MNFGVLSMCSIFVLFAVSIWCVFSPRYNDGVIGKSVFIMLALSCYAALTEYPRPPSGVTITVMLSSMAFVIVRHIFLKSFKFSNKREKDFFYD